MSAPSLPGLTITGVVGFGSHGPIRLGRWEGRDVTVREVQKAALPHDSHVRRFSHLREIDTPHISPIVHVAESATSFTVLSQFVSGPTLSALRAGGAGVTLSQGWRLLADIAEALAQLHSRGIIHADLSPANVLVRSAHPHRGRAVVIDVGGEEVWELGTVGFRAPEIAEGSPASAASDVWSAGRVALWAVHEDHRLRFGEHLRGVLDPEAHARPTAAEVVTLAGAWAAEAIDLPEESRLASGHLRAKSSDVPTTRARRRSRGARGSGTSRMSHPRLKARVRAAPGRAPAPRVRSHARPGRRGRRPRGSVAVAYGGAVLVLTVIASFSFFSPQGTVAEPTSSPSAPARTGAPVDLRAAEARPQEAVVALTRIRDSALVHQDLERLQSVTVPGSAAAKEDRRLLQSFRGAAPAGLRTAVSVGEVGGEARAPIIEVTLTQHPFTWVGGARDGVAVAGLPPRCARVHLEVLEGRWRVSAITACRANSKPT